MANNAIASRRIDQAVSGFLATAIPDNVLVADRILPTIDVGSKNYSGKLWSDDPRQYIASGEMINGTALRRAPSAPYPETGNYDPLSTTFECQEHSNKDFIPEVVAARSTFPLAEEQRRSPKILNNLLMQQEVATAGFVFDTAAHPNTNVALASLSGSDTKTWADADADVAKHGLLAREAVRSQTGVLPNKAIITYDCLKSLRYSQQIAGFRVIPGGDGSDGVAAIGNRGVTSTSAILRILAELWEVESVEVFKSQYNNARPKATKSLAEVATAKAVFYCDQGMRGAAEVVGGVTVAGGPVSFLRIREYGPRGYRWMSEDPPGVYIAAAHSYDLVIPAGMADTAYILTACLG